MTAASSGGASRREALKLAGAGTAGLALAGALVARPTGSETPTDGSSHDTGGTASHADESHPNAVGPSAEPSPDAYLGDLAGQQLGSYRVRTVGGLERGGIPVELVAPSGVAFRVDVLRFDPSEGRRGIGDVSSVTVYLRNGGDGAKATDEELGLGAMALASELARREHLGRDVPSGLLTMAERAAIDASST
jgi:hypothetical protein